MQERFAFGPFVLSPEAGTLLRQGVPVPVGYRALLLLTELVRHAGEVLTKTDLMDVAWPGTAVEESNLSVQIASLRKLLGPASDGMDWIATIPRVGYRFAGEIEKLDDTTAARSPSEPGPSIAVLPFANLSGDIEQQYFADGLAEDIITRISRLRWLFVSARNSSFSYRGKLVDVTQIGRELGVRYVLDGSVRRSGQRLRIGAELSDTSSGRQVWAERYDVQLADFFELQDQIADSVIGAIEPKLYAAEHQRFQGRSPGNLDAWGFVMKAMPHVWSWGSAAEIDAAEGLLKQASDLDPDYPRANCLLALMLATRVLLGLDERAAHTAGRPRHGGPGDPARRRRPVDALRRRFCLHGGAAFHPGDRSAERGDRPQPELRDRPHDPGIDLRLRRHARRRPASPCAGRAVEPARLHPGGEPFGPGHVPFRGPQFRRSRQARKPGGKASPAFRNGLAHMGRGGRHGRRPRTPPPGRWPKQDGCNRR